MADNTHRQAWTGLFGGLALLASIAILGFLPETMAIVWHIRYGTRVTVGQYEVPVPLLWYGSFEDDQRSLSAMPVAGRFRRARMKQSQVAMVVYSVSPRLVAEDRRLAMGKLPSTTLTVAGQPTSCFTATRSVVVDVVDITCLPPPGADGLTADFMGDRSLVPQFFELLRQVRRKPGQP